MTSIPANPWMVDLRLTTFCRGASSHTTCSGTWCRWQRRRIPKREITSQHSELYLPKLALLHREALRISSNQKALEDYATGFKQSVDELRQADEVAKLFEL